DLMPSTIVHQTREPIGDQLDLLLVAAGTVGIDANGVTAEQLGGIYPLVVVHHRLLAFGLVGIAEVALAVAHDQDAGHALVVGDALHLGEVFLVFAFTLVELI